MSEHARIADQIRRAAQGDAWHGPPLSEVLDDVTADEATAHPNPGAVIAGSQPYLALGDSYTIGEGVAPEQRWPARLAALLRGRGCDVGDPEIIARTGWTCAELGAAIDAADPRGPFALVSLLAGVNDQYRGATALDYAMQFAPLLQRARALAGGDRSRVVVLSIPDWSVSPFAAQRDRAAIAAAIDDFNTVNLKAARAAGAGYVDITPSSRRAAAPAQFVADGLHPAAPLYDAWARLALDAAAAATGG